MLFREGNLKAVKRILSFFKAFSKGRLSLTSHTLIIPYTLLRTIQIGWDSIQMLEKKIPKDLPPEKGQGIG
jgi:hypothetical protein